MIEVYYSIVYYLIWFCIGIAAFVLLKKVFYKQTSNNSKILIYAISKPLGLILLGYPIWILSSIKLFNFNPNINVQIVFVSLMLSLLAYFFIKFYKADFSSKTKTLENFKFNETISSLITLIKEKVRINKTLFIRITVIEIIGILLYAIYLYIRSHKPNIDSTEKPMDLLMLMSAGKTSYFPFFDPWNPSEPVNYYYYGFYLFALILKIADIPYSIGYNLSLGIIFSQSFVLTFSFVHYLTKKITGGIIAGLLLLFAGNLHYANCILENGFNNLTATCFYAKATRILDPAYTINEIPSYSFVLGDLHPHVLSIIFFISTLSLIALWYNDWKNKNILYLLTISISSTGLINFWDFMTLGLIYGVMFIIKCWNLTKEAIKNIRQNASEKSNSLIKLTIIKLLQNKSIVHTTLLTLFMTVSPFILFAPFFSHFESPVMGIGQVLDYIHQMKSVGIEITQSPSSAYFLFGIWGGFWILIALSIFTILIFNTKKLQKLTLIIVIFLAANFLILFTELFFFKDLFHYMNPPYFRSNTVFKLTYHSWILMNIATGALVSTAWHSLEKINNMVIGIISDLVFSLISMVILGALLIYAFLAYHQAYGIKSFIFNNNLSLDGTLYIKRQDEADYEVIQWLNKNQKTRVVIVEAVGNAYSYNGRIGVHTGMGNIINWPSHQWTWRFKYPKGVKNYKDVIKERPVIELVTKTENLKEVVRNIYEYTDPHETLKLLKHHNVEYVYIGKLERSQYVVSEEKFNQIGTIVFEKNNSRLYKIKYLN